MDIGYQSPVLICIDAVLSIQRKYYSFVVPRVVSFSEEHKDINSLKKLCDLIDRIGYEGFCQYWNYKHIERVRMLYDLASYFLKLSESLNKPEFLVMQEWAKNTSVEESFNFPVKGIGLATFQYLRKLLRASTVKPDVHIKRAISMAIGREVKDIYAINLIEAVGEEIGKSAIDIDYFIWSLFVEQGSNPPYVWKNTFWVKNLS